LAERHDRFSATAVTCGTVGAELTSLTMLRASSLSPLGDRDARTDLFAAIRIRFGIELPEKTDIHVIPDLRSENPQRTSTFALAG
jgi:hypothetical protein